jgi:shikimate kinase
MKSETIVLIGRAGVGKFTVGKPLSGASGLDFMDLVNEWRQRK